MSPFENKKFDPAKFINRKRETQMVETLVSEVALTLRSQGQPRSPRVMVFTGERGLGKTWLLHQIEHIVCQKSNLPVKCCYLNLKEYQGLDPLVAIRRILNDIARSSLEMADQMELGAGELSQTVIQKIGQVFGDQIFMLLIDHVYESKWELLGALETFVLAPLVVRPNVVLVMAGRGKAFPWAQRELVVPSVELAPFNLEDTQRQLDENPGEAQAVQSISRGVPLANFYLRRGTSADDLLGYIEDILEVIPEDERPISQDSLIALSILQAFDETRLKEMLAIYQDRPEWAEAPYGRLRQIKETLFRSGFAAWMPTARGNVLQETTRRILEKYLKLKAPRKWGEMHQKAIDIYHDYLQKYPNGTERWNLEIDYHQDQLAHHSPVSPEVAGPSQGRK
jgi:hypothetical protein